MPIYEYRCEQCGDFEEMQRITDPPLARCPRCKRKVRRLISNTSFQLKGSGWYVTDYARAGSTQESKKSGESTKKDDTTESETKKTETKKTETSGTTDKAASTTGGKTTS